MPLNMFGEPDSHINIRAKHIVPNNELRVKACSKIFFIDYMHASSEKNSYKINWWGLLPTN